MSFLVSDAYNDALTALNSAGQSVDETDYLYFLNETNKEYMTQTKAPTTERVHDLVLYGGINEYPLPSDWLAIIEPELPYGQTSPRFSHVTSRDFSHFPHGRITGIRHDRENGFLIANEPSATYALINGCDSLTADGTWTISGDGSALVSDEEVKTQGGASVRFTVTPSGGSTTLECAGFTAFNVTDFLTQGRFALDLGCPSANTTALASVTLRLGSDASNYYSMQATIRHRGDTILGGFGIISFDPLTKTTTGTPTDTAIDYLAVIVNHGTTGVSGTYRLDNIFACSGIYYRLPYYSRSNVKTQAGAYQQDVTATDDTFLCPPDLDGLYKYETLLSIAKLRLQDTGLADEFALKALPYRRTLRAKYPSKEQRIQTTKYRRWNTF
jgi:hypothetical protein